MEWDEVWKKEGTPILKEERNVGEGGVEVRIFYLKVVEK